MSDSTNIPHNFTYTYSAPRRTEIEQIRDKYRPRSDRESDLQRLRRLDRNVSRGAIIVSLTAGILGTLLLGVGMSAVMVPGFLSPWVGIPVGLVGLAAAAMAFPLYRAVLKRRREKGAAEILALADRLLQ